MRGREALCTCREHLELLRLGVFALLIIGPSVHAQTTTAAVSAIVPPLLVKPPVVTFPEDAQREGICGDVVADLELDDTGVVQRVRVTSAPDPRLAWAALGSLTNLEFVPARHVEPDGSEHPTAVRFSYILTFSLDGGAGALEHDRLAALGVSGRVVDRTGAPIAAAEVAADGTEIWTQTDDGGAFTLQGLPPGDVVLRVAASGFTAVRVVVHRHAPEPETHADVTIQLASATDDVVPTGGVTVVGARRAPESAQATLTQDVAVVDASTLARVRGRSLAGALSEVPGIAMVQSGPSLAKPVVRGAFGRRVVMLVDGVRHEGQDWGIDHAPEIDPQAAGRIEIVKGAAGVRYGPDAIGGVVLVEPRPLRVAPGLDGEVSLVGVDNGLRGLASGRVDFVLPAAAAWSFRLEGNASKGAAVSTPTYVLGNTASELGNIAATAAWHGSLLQTDASLKLSYRRFQAKLGICYCLRITTPAELADAVQATTPVGAGIWTTSYTLDRPRQEVSHDTALVRGTIEIGDLGHLTATYAFQLDLRDEFDQVRSSVQGPQFHFQLLTHSADAIFEHRPWSAGRFTLRGQAGAHGDVQEHAYSGLQLIPNFRRFVGGVFALERIVIDDMVGSGDLELVFGARGDGLLQTAFLSEQAFVTQVRRGRLAEDACKRTDDVARCEKNLAALSFTAGARVHVDLSRWADAAVFAVDLSSATRFPDVDELYLGGRAPSFPVFGLGDASLLTERTLQLSLSTKLQFAPYVALDAGVFASRIDDYIAFGPELDAAGKPVVDVLITGAYPRFASRAVDAMLSGIDGGLVISPDGILSLAVQGALVQGVDLTTGGFLPFIPPPQLRVEMSSHVPDLLMPEAGLPLRGTRLSLELVSTARQDRSDRRTDFVAPPDGYALLNASVGTVLPIGDFPLSVSVEIRNITNARYREALSLTRFFVDEPGREVWLRLESSFGDVPDGLTADGAAPASEAPR